jgi:hypothetical protein
MFTFRNGSFLAVFMFSILLLITFAPMVSADEPEITVDPTSASEDTLITVDGTGFGIEETVTLELGDYFVRTITTDTEGNFHTNFTVKDTWNPDDYELIAAQSDTSITAAASFSVTDAQATSTPTQTYYPQETDDPYIDQPTILTEPDNTGTTIAIIAAVIAAIIIPVSLLYFRGSIGGRGRRNRRYDDFDPYYPQGPNGYGNGVDSYPQYSQFPNQYPSSYQAQQYSRPYGASQYGSPAGYGSSNYGGYGGYSRDNYRTQYSSGGQGNRGTKVCPACRQVVRAGTYSCPYCNTRLM